MMIHEVFTTVNVCKHGDRFALIPFTNVHEVSGHKVEVLRVPFNLLVKFGYAEAIMPYARSVEGRQEEEQLT